MAAIFNRDVAQIDAPKLLDVRTHGDLLYIVFDKGEMGRFIVVMGFTPTLSHSL